MQDIHIKTMCVN